MRRTQTVCPSTGCQLSADDPVLGDGTEGRVDVAAALGGAAERLLVEVLPWPLDQRPSGRPPAIMPASAAALRRVLVGQYEDLKKRLSWRLGSPDLAADALHEAYLHLDHFPHQGIVNNPQQYLLTMATNIARMGQRRERRWTNLDDADAISGFVDESPDPLRSLAARQEVEALLRAFGALTPRRRRILVASRVEGVRLRDLAAELGLSQRMVEKELKAALRLCGVALGRGIVQRFGPRHTPADAVGEARDG